MLCALLLSLALLAMWLVLNRDYSLGQWILGAVVATIVPVVTHSLRPTPVRVRRLDLAFLLFMRVGWDVIVWNWKVLRGTLASSATQPKGGFITVPLDLRDPNGLAVLAMIVCITPGTVWAELSRDRSMLMLHVLEVHDREAIVQHVQTRYERPLMEIFE